MNEIVLLDVVDAELVDELCEYCRKRPGTLMADPLAADVDGDDSLHVICDPCADSQALDL